jgi:four helix bundle protein
MGMTLAVRSWMSVKELEDLVAYQLAVECKKEVYRLVRAHPSANSDFRYRSQVYKAAASTEANIAEGWRRFGARDMSRFLKYALGSIEETKRRVSDGAHRGYFTEEACEPALALARRCGAATMGLWRSLGPYR